MGTGKKSGDNKVEGKASEPSPAEQTAALEMIEVPAWNRGLIYRLSSSRLLCELLVATNYSEMDLLYERVVQLVADALRGKRAEEIRVFWGVKDDISAERKRQIMQARGWRFDPGN